MAGWLTGKSDPARGASAGRWIALLVGFAAAHAALLWLGYACRYSTEPVATFWPATGFAMSVLLLIHRRRWWAVLLVMFVVETLVMFLVETPVAGSVFQAWSLSSVTARFANLFEAWLGATLISQRLGPDVRIWGLRLALTILVVAIVSSAIGGLVTAVAKTIEAPETFSRAFFSQWFFSDGLGVMLIVPLVLTWSDAPHWLRNVPTARSLAEPALFLVSTLCGALFVFGADWLPTFSVFHHPYLIYPFFIWASLRLHPRFVTAGLVLISLVLVLDAHAGYGPFVKPDRGVKEAVLSIQAFLAVMSVTTLVLSAVVTDRKRAYAELARSEERFRLAIEAVGEGAYDWNVRTGDVYVTERWLNWLGFTTEEQQLLDEFWRSLIHPDDKPGVLRQLEDHLDGRSARFDAEYRLRRKSGEYRWNRGRGRVVSRDGDGTPLRMVGTEDDVTALKTAREQLAHMEARLAHVARLSTMGELVAGIAHEVNQPLYSIVNYAKANRNLLARGDGVDVELLEQWNEQIAEAAVRAGAIIKRLRAFVTRREFQRQPSDINRIVQEACDLVAFVLRNSHVRVDRDLAPDLPPVLVDPVQIQQVLVNLIRNACEAMESVDDAQRRILIETACDAHAVQVTVMDHGPGLSQDAGWNPFDTFVTTKPEGMGMGLAISKTIIEAHGGRIWSITGRRGGAEFLFTLPTGSAHDHDRG